MIEPITVIVTSCGRFDLLEKTLQSFFELNTYPIFEFHIHEDCAESENTGWVKILKERYPFMKWHFAKERRGLAASLDYLMSQVKTEYVLGLENDWHFEGNKNFIQDGITLMDSLPDIDQVWFRSSTDHTHKLSSNKYYGDIPYKLVLKQGDWGGLSWNPRLIKLSTYKVLFPNGYSEYGDEIDCSKHVEKLGYTAVSLVHSACKHIGYGRHTDNFKV